MIADLMRYFLLSTVALVTSTAMATTAPPEGAMWAREYYNATQDHYFLTAVPHELYMLDTGLTPGWQYTERSFLVGSTSRFVIRIPPSEWGYGDPNLYFNLQPVCRFYLPPESGDSHFMSASPFECSEVRLRFPTFVLESSAAFYALLPDLGTGGCPEQFAPVFRLWNRRVDTNHRYTISLGVRSQMIAQGYVSEGYGPQGVAFCVPRGM